MPVQATAGTQMRAHGPSARITRSGPTGTSSNAAARPARTPTPTEIPNQARPVTTSGGFTVVAMSPNSTPSINPPKPRRTRGVAPDRASHSGTQATKIRPVHCSGGNAPNSRTAVASAASDCAPSLALGVLATMRPAGSEYPMRNRACSEFGNQAVARSTLGQLSRPVFDLWYVNCSLD